MIKKIGLMIIFCFITTSAYGETDYQKYIIKPDKRESLLQRFFNSFKTQAFDKSYAIIIAVSDYERLATLPSSGKDAEKMKQYLISTGEYDEIVVLQDEEATFDTIRYFMESYFPEQMEKEGDYRFLFYFTGHGTQHKGYGDKTIGYLQLKGSTGTISDRDAIGMNQIEDWSDRLRYAKHVLFLLDCCFSGLAGVEKKGGYDTRADPIALSRENGRHMITAGGTDEVSIADSRWGGSLFTDVVITGMQGDADTNNDSVVTIYELFVYANGAVKREAQRARYSQNPLISDLGTYKDKGQYFFVYKDIKSGKKIADLDITPEEKEGQTIQPPIVKPVKEKAITNSLGMKFVYIQPGTFTMGSPADEPGRDSDETQHKVTLTKGFYMQTTEVTQGQWKAVMGNNPSGFKDCGDNCPVENVSWNDAQKFIKKLNELDGGGNKYRLPTEAEWEYAARAGGTTTPFAFGKCLSTDDANYDGNYPLEGCPKGKDREKTIPVGSLKANDWGLYDMHGNVWEWCEDWHGDYPTGSVTDSVGPEAGSGRVVRGGGWNNNARNCRSANRNNNSPDNRNDNIGFRLARAHV